MTRSAFDDEDHEFQVLVNDEEQYSLWLAGRAIPVGWRQVGPTGSKTECVGYVEETWTNLVPRSLRRDS